MKPIINAVEDDVYQITLTPPLEGFADFISAWLVKGPRHFWSTSARLQPPSSSFRRLKRSAYPGWITF